MKLFVPALILCLALLTSGCRKHSETMTVVIDCTGTYLRLDDDGQDYKVCNLDMMEGFEAGDQVTVSFFKELDCDDPSQPEVICALEHAFESWIRVESIS